MDRFTNVAGAPDTIITLMETAEMKRKTMSVLTAAAFVALLSLAGCSDDDGAAEEAGESVDEAVEEAGDEVEEATD